MQRLPTKPQQQRQQQQQQPDSSVYDKDHMFSSLHGGQTSGGWGGGTVSHLQIISPRLWSKTCLCVCVFAP